MDYFNRHDKSKVSVIIPSCKGDKQLPSCVEGVLASTYKNVELVIVCEGKERSIQRNIGIERAKGEYLLFLDSDQVINKDLIQECVDLIQHCVSIYIQERVVTPGWFGRFRDWERQFYTGTAVDVVKFLRKKDCPKFNENMNGPEDSDWDRKIKGHRLLSLNCLYHYDNVTFMGYFKKKAYYSKSMAVFASENPGDKILDWKWRCFGVFLEKGKWKRLFHWYTFVLIFVIFIRGVIYRATTLSNK